MMAHKMILNEDRLRKVKNVVKQILFIRSVCVIPKVNWVVCNQDNVQTQSLVVKYVALKHLMMLRPVWLKRQMVVLFQR